MKASCWTLLALLFPALVSAGTVSYTDDTTDFANPERGFSLSFYYYGPGNGNNEAITSGNIARDITKDDVAGEPNITLIRRLYVLSGYANTPILDSGLLNDLTTDFQNARATGVKLIPRFCYNWGGQDGSGYADAPLGTITGHLQQLTPLLYANEDVIAYMEAGFVGEWGEWHDSTNNLTDPSNNNAIPALGTVLNAVLTALPQDRMVAVRYPGYTLQIFGEPPAVTAANAYDGSPFSRVGVHDDCFEADPYDEGTYAKGTSLNWNVAQFKSFLSQQVYSISVGGETCGQDDPYSQCTNSMADLANLHWTMLNSEYNGGNITEWGNGGCLDSIKTGLGYRFRLVQTTVPASVLVGSALSVGVVVTNDGFANCYNPRPLEVILRPVGQSGVGTALPVSETATLGTDPRFWLPGQAVTTTLTVVVPSGLSAGSYAVLLNLPDGKSSLYGMPAYSIRLADQGVWEPATGYNLLNQTLTLVTCPACTPTITLTPTLSPTPSNTPVPGTGTIVGIDFIGGSASNGMPSAMGAGETAGVVPAANWNSEPGTQGGQGDLQDNLGGSTSATLTYQAGTGMWSLPIAETAGNSRMMKGYLDTDNTASTTVSVTGLPYRITGGTYSVYVYFDGDNAGNSRTARYTLNGATLSGVDAPNANFNGSFSPATAGGAGNYVVFTGLTATGFTLTAAAGASTDAYPRAPINGIEIVANPLTTTASPTRTATSTAVPSPTPTQSPSASATPTATPSTTETASPTRSQSPTASATSTHSASPSATASPTPSLSPTGTPTASPRPTASLTRTDSPVVSPTSTPMATPPVTATPTATSSASVTSTGSPSATPELTATPSAAPTFTSSATASPWPSASSTPSSAPTDTCSATASSSATPTDTATESPLASPSSTGTSGLTGSPTPTGSPSPTAVDSASPTVSPETAIDADPSPTPSPTVSLTSTLTLVLPWTSTPAPGSTPPTPVPATATPTAVPTPASTLDPLPAPGNSWNVASVVGVPNPNPRALLAELTGGADSVEIRVYGPSLALVRAVSVPGPWEQGWNRVALAPDFWAGLPQQPYFLRVRALRAGVPGAAKILTAFLLAGAGSAP